MEAVPARNSQRRFQEMIDGIKAHGMRLTPQRAAVVRILAFTREHPSVEQIHTAVKADFPMTSLATVYKTIGLLKTLGEVAELAFGDGNKRYDAAKPFSHPHLICTRCHRIVDSHPGSLSRLAGELARETGFSIQSLRLDLFGLCPGCQDRQNSAPWPDECLYTDSQ